VKQKPSSVLECGHKPDTPGHHLIKPRARQLRFDQWMVHSHGVSAFDSTLDGALHLWRRCFLLGQIERHGK
jgi:hypothetical protein